MLLLTPSLTVALKAAICCFSLNCKVAIAVVGRVVVLVRDVFTVSFSNATLLH